MDGWILLWKKIWKSDNFQCKNKSKMILVWIWLLTYCDARGKVTAGRDQIAREIGISSSSVQRAINNLKTKMISEVNIKPNSIFTEFHILNYLKYQRKANKQADSKRTASEQQADTNKELKNKNIDIDTKVSKSKALIKKSNPEIDQIINSFKKEFNSDPIPQKQQRYYCNHLLNKHTLEEILNAIKFARLVVEERYAPAITTPKDLYYKWDQLKIFYARKKKEGPRTLEE